MKGFKGGRQDKTFDWHLILWNLSFEKVEDFDKILSVGHDPHLTLSFITNLNYSKETKCRETKYTKLQKQR